MKNHQFIERYFEKAQIMQKNLKQLRAYYKSYWYSNTSISTKKKKLFIIDLFCTELAVTAEVDSGLTKFCKHQPLPPNAPEIAGIEKRNEKRKKRRK